MPTVRGRKSGGGSPSKKKSGASGAKKRMTAKPLKTKGKAPVRKAAARPAPRKSAAKKPAKAARTKPSSRTVVRKPARGTSAVRKLVRKAVTATKSAARKASAAGSKVARPVREVAKASVPRPAKTVKRAAAKPSARPVRRPSTAAGKTIPARPVAKIPKSAASRPAAKAPKPGPRAKTQEKPIPSAAASAKAKKAAPSEAAGNGPGVKPALAKAEKKPAAAKGTRRSRARVTSSEGPIATWLTPENRPRPSSFIPAPPRAESPSLVAAPPASSDRLIHPAHLEEPEPGIRLYPVRVDIEQSAGRIYVVTNPDQLSIHVGEGVEWDFRYLGGADASVEEVVIEMEKPGPFAKTTLKSHKPGSARPHRQISGPAIQSSSGRSFEYTIRCLDVVKRVLATGRPTLVVL